MSFWKKLFKKEEKKEEIDFFQLGKWLIDNVPILNEVQTNLSEMREVILHLTKDTNILEAVDISDKKVEEKLKTMIKGNKPAYLRQLRLLLKKIQVPENYDHKTVCSFVDKVEDELKDFNKRTARNYYVLQSLIGDELAAIATNLKKLDSVNKKIKETACKGKLKELEDVQDNLNEIYAYLEGRTEEEKQLKNLQKEKEKFMQQERKLREEAEKFKTGLEFQELSKLKSKRDNLVEKEYELKTAFEGDFSLLKRALRKLDKLDKLKTIKGYAEEPYETFFKDKDMQIIKVIGSLKSSIEKGKISLKNKDKVMNIINLMTEDYLVNLKKKLENITKEISQVEEKISKNTFEEKQYELARKLELHLQEMGKIDEKINKLKKRDVKQEIEELKDSLKKVVDVKVELENVPLD